MNRRPLPPHSTRRAPAFTLIELMVVIGIIALMLVALIPAVNSLSKSGGRKAAIGSLLGAAEQARANAIKTGRATYLVFPTFSSSASANTLDRYHYRAFAIFEDDPANLANPKQLTTWKSLPTGVALRAKTGATGSVTDLPDAGSLTPAVTLAFTPESTATPVFHCVKFNGNGEVESPAANATIAVFEGHVNGTSEIITGAKAPSGEPAAIESMTIAHLTGRAEIAP